MHKTMQVWRDWQEKNEQMRQLLLTSSEPLTVSVSEVKRKFKCLGRPLLNVRHKNLLSFHLLIFTCLNLIQQIHIPNSI